MRRDRRPSADELALWKRMTADVEPLETVVPNAEPKMRPAASAKDKDKDKDKDKKDRERRSTTSNTHISPLDPEPRPDPRPQALDPNRPVNIDRRNWERLKRGQIAIEGRLDLHGRTQREAHAALDRFLQAAAANGHRCVLVVTGKGGPERIGVLRQMVPRWLEEKGNRDTVLTYSPAQPRHGGDGALYVMIKRRRGDEKRRG